MEENLVNTKTYYTENCGGEGVQIKSLKDIII